VRIAEHDGVHALLLAEGRDVEAAGEDLPAGLVEDVGEEEVEERPELDQAVCCMSVVGK
jgi:hypothetical protein